MASPARPPVLTPEILDRWREACGRVGADVAIALGPGLTDAEIDEIIAPLGYPVADEVRTLWRWATVVDGKRIGRGVNEEHDFLLPKAAVASTLALRDMVQEWRPFPESAVVLFKGDRGAAILARDGADEILAYGSIEEEWPFSPARTLGELFEHWTQQMLTGELVASHGMFDVGEDHNGYWLPGRDPVSAQRPLDDNGYPLPVPGAD